MEALKFRTLYADEIDVRVQQVIFTDKFKGVLLLLYKDARVDMNLLDEVTGSPLNWKREHSRDNANCIVSIWDDDRKQWVSKEDTGSESNTEKEKGLASDSFKRACVNWGIGRELYTSPKPMIAALPEDYFEAKTYTSRDGSKETKYEVAKRVRFSVKEIEYDSKRRISKLVILDQSGNVIFEFPKSKAADTKKEPAKTEQKPAAKPAEKQPAPVDKKEEPKKYPDEYYDMLADIESADTIAACIANITLAVGQDYLDEIRRAAVKRGINIATSKEEVKKIYGFIQDKPGWEEMKALANKVVAEKKLQ